VLLPSILPRETEEKSRPKEKKLISLCVCTRRPRDKKQKGIAGLKDSCIFRHRRAGLERGINKPLLQAKRFHGERDGRRALDEATGGKEQEQWGKKRVRPRRKQ